MMCFNDKCYCNRSKESWCEENDVAPCKNLLCYRHCWELPIPSGDENLLVAWADFGNNCKDYFNKDIQPLKCPFCDGDKIVTTYRQIGTGVTSKGVKLINYYFRATCKRCESTIGAIRMNNVEMGDSKAIELGKLCAIWKWNGYGRRKVKDGERCS